MFGEARNARGCALDSRGSSLGNRSLGTSVSPAALTIGDDPSELVDQMIEHDDDIAWNHAHRGETDLQRLDRNLVELVSELRVMQTGVQVLFAFLLTVPFTTRFIEIGAFDRIVYVVTLLCAAIACAFLMAPAACHRLLFRRRDKRYLVWLANRMALAGLAFVGAAMIGVVLLVTSVILSPIAAAALSGGTAVVFLVLWLVLPMRRRRRLRSSVSAVTIPIRFSVPGSPPPRG